jgi:15-cis-phytoene synthase
MDSMRVDCDRVRMADRGQLDAYMNGSAAAVGRIMAPLLGAPAADRETVAALGVAFQLTNFIRDVGEDLRRGRVYLPQESLDLFGVTRQHLARGVADGPIRRLLSHEIARTREIYTAAQPGIRLLAPESRDCIRTAFSLYGGILDAVEHSGYDVLVRRVAVPGRRRIAVAVPGLFRAARARRRIG